MSRWLILRKWLIYKAAKIYLIADLVVGNEFPPRTAQIPRFPPVPHRSKSRINTHKRGKKKDFSNSLDRQEIYRASFV